MQNLSQESQDFVSTGPIGFRQEISTNFKFLENKCPKMTTKVALAFYIAKKGAKLEDLSAFQIAEIYAYQGETDKAFEWLERAYKQRDGGLAEMKGDPLLRSLERDPRPPPLPQKKKPP